MRINYPRIFVAYRFTLATHISEMTIAQKGCLGVTVVFFAVALVKETCHVLGSGFDGPVMVRLLHRDTNKYVCFNKRGRIRTVVSAICVSLLKSHFM